MASAARDPSDKSAGYASGPFDDNRRSNNNGNDDLYQSSHTGDYAHPHSENGAGPLYPQGAAMAIPPTAAAANGSGYEYAPVNHPLSAPSYDTHDGVDNNHKAAARSGLSLPRGRRLLLLLAAAAALTAIVIVAVVVPIVLVKRNHNRDNLVSEADRAAAKSNNNPAGFAGEGADGLTEPSAAAAAPGRPSSAVIGGGYGASSASADAIAQSDLYGTSGSVITMENGQSFTYINEFGGSWASAPFDDSAKANSWTPALNQPWDFTNDK